MLEWPFFEERHREFVASAQVPDGRGERARRALPRVRARARPTAGWSTRSRAPLDVRTLCLARETLAYHDALADFAFAMQGLGAGPITLFGDDALRDALPAGGGRAGRRSPRSRCRSRRPAPTSRR